MRLENGTERVKPAAHQRPHFLDGACRHHGIEARIDPSLELVTVGRQEQFDRPAGLDQRRHAVAMPIGKRPPGRVEHFERTRDPHPIARPQLGGRRRIAARQLGVKRRGTFGFEPATDR